MAQTRQFTASMITRKHNSASNYNGVSASQEFYGTSASENLCGVLHFAGMDLTNKVLTAATIRTTAAKAGYGGSITKDLHIRKSNYQAKAQSGVTGAQYAGDLLGTLTGQFYDNTATYQITGSLLTALGAYLQQGKNTLCLYNPSPVRSGGSNWSDNYLKLDAATLTLTYEEGISQPTVSSSDVVMGTSVTISTNRLGDATHTLRYAFAGASGTIATGITTSHAWTPPVTLASQITNASAGTCTIYCDTYYGGVLTGTKSVSITLSVPASVVPIISSVTTAEAVAGLNAQFGAYVQSKSRLSVGIAATGEYGSTITERKAAINGKTYSGASITTDYLTTAGNNTLTITVKDSRGRTTTTNRTIAVTAYAPPKITTFTAERCNEAGTASQPDGNRVRINLTTTASSVGSNNTMTVTVRYRQRGNSTWTTDRTYSHSGYAVDVTNSRLNGTYDTLLSYEFQVTVADYFGSALSYAEVGTMMVLLDFRADGKGVGIGKISERTNAVEVNPEWEFWAGGKNLANPPTPEMGLRNYLLDSDQVIICSTNYNTDWGPGGFSVSPEFIENAKGREIIISFDWWYASWLNSGKCGLYLNYKRADGTTGYVTTNAVGKHTGSPNDSWVRHNEVAIFPTDAVSNVNAYFWLNLPNWSKLRHPMIAIGNMATDWVPSPEDYMLPSRGGTGKNNVIDAYSNLAYRGLLYNYNNATQNGYYFLPWDSTNGPKAEGGFVEVKNQIVDSKPNIEQKYVAISSRAKWTRTFYNDTWQAWREDLYKDAQLLKDVLIGEVNISGTTATVTFSRTLSAVPFITTWQNGGTPTGIKVTSVTATGFSITTGIASTNWKWKAEVF